MAKVPRAGNVKTRLQPFLSAAQCRTLAEAFVSDAINKARNVCDELIVAFSPSSESSYFNAADLTLIAQKGSNLGEKMSHAFEFAFVQNSDAKVLMIGTDSPTFPDEFIERAFETLDAKAEIVLGKSADGGFYLIGLRKNSPRLFAKIEWSSPQVYEQITRNIKQLSYELKTIPEWFDVDEAKDLRRLHGEILSDEQTRKLAPETYQWLLANADIFSTSDSESKF